jgi:hypothetical protein
MKMCWSTEILQLFKIVVFWRCDPPAACQDEPAMHRTPLNPVMRLHRKQGIAVEWAATHRVGEGRSWHLSVIKTYGAC